MKKLFHKSDPVYLITDRSISGLTHAQITRLALSSGVKTIQLREKEMTKRVLYEEALKMRKITFAHNATFIVNDYIDIALASGADGVHLGQEDMPIQDARKVMGRKRIIGISTHSLRQAVLAEEAGADYIGFGPVFPTATKDAGTPRGVGALKQIRRRITIPVVAIGGITWDNISEVLDAGADNAAVASAILSGNIRENTEKFHRAIKNNGLK